MTFFITFCLTYFSKQATAEMGGHKYCRTGNFWHMKFSRISGTGDSHAGNVRKFLKSRASQLSNGVFGLKIGPILRPWEQFIDQHVESFLRVLTLKGLCGVRADPQNFNGWSYSYYRNPRAHIPSNPPQHRSSLSRSIIFYQTSLVCD